MRQKARELIKGEWYADVEYATDMVTFLRYSHSNEDTDFSSEIKGFETYKPHIDGLYHFDKTHDSFIPTPEDIEKYKLNEKE